MRSHNFDNLESGFVLSKLKIKTQKKNQKSTLNLFDIVYPIEGVDPTQGTENKNETIANTRRSTLKGKDNRINNIESDLSKIKVEKNEEEDEMWGKNKNNNRNSKKVKKESVLPSGANFDKIIPEVGVIVKGEKSKEIKEGGFDYVKKYNKPSFNELSKFISESINANSNYYSSLMNSHNDVNKNNGNINNYLNNDRSKTEENNYIGYKEEFNENNPLIQNAHNIKYYSPSKNKYNNDINLNKSNVNGRNRNLIQSYDRVKKDNSQFQSIQLSQNFNNLKLTNIFDDAINNSINNTNANKYAKEVDNIDNLNYLERAVLPFKNLRYKKQNGQRKLIDIGDNTNMKEYNDQAYINKFNSQIVNNKMWGKEDDDIYKMQERLNREMKGENQNKGLFRKQRNNNNRMKDFGMQIMTEGTSKRERKVPLFGGNLK